MERRIHFPAGGFTSSVAVGGVLLTGIYTADAIGGGRVLCCGWPLSLSKLAAYLTDLDPFVLCCGCHVLCCGWPLSLPKLAAYLTDLDPICAMLRMPLGGVAF